MQTIRSELETGRETPAPAFPLPRRPPDAANPVRRDGASAMLIPAGAVIGFGVLILATGQRDYPNLHTILDTATFILAAVVATLLRDIGRRLGRGFSAWLAVSFAVTAALDLLHVLAAVQWWGFLAPIADLHFQLRPKSWAPAAYLLPIGIGASIWLLLRGEKPVRLFPLFVALLGIILFEVFRSPSPYAPADWFGITRPTLVPVPFLWVAVGAAAWRWRNTDRKLAPIAGLSIILIFASGTMLYSAAPDDTTVVVSHFCTAGAYLLFLVSLMRMAAGDMQDRLEAERALAALNSELETRVADRTAQIAATNLALQSEIAERTQAERRAQSQLQRLKLLHEITRAIGARLDLASIYQVAIRSVEDQLPTDFCCLYLQGPDGTDGNTAGVGTKSVALAASFDTKIPANAEVAASLSACIGGELVYEPDLVRLDFAFGRRLAAGGMGSAVLAPLRVESDLLGVLIAARKEANGFSSGECEFLQQLSEHVALAAHQARLYHALQQVYDDLRQTQQAVMQQERLRALGQMASGIAHDINNALTPASLYVESLLESDQLHENQRATLEVVRRAVEDVTHTVARLREFYRQSDAGMTVAPVQLNEIVEQVVDLTRARWSDIPMQRGVTIEMSRDLAAGLPPIMGVESEIREALVNLVLNAADALPNGGRIQFRTSRVPGGETSSNRVLVEVADNGAGMDEDTRRRCLEPFFSTKGKRGTGLGLAMVYGIVQRHGANIEIDSAPGHGTKIRLLFGAAVPSGAAATAVAADERIQRRLRLLLVDDDPVLLKSLSDILEIDGHVVTAADGGEAGIAAFRSAAGTDSAFHCVITDLGMPHVDGRKVAAAIKSASPTTPVILLTGWGQRLITEDDIPAQVDIVLSKPPKLSDLRRALFRLSRPESDTGAPAG